MTIPDVLVIGGGFSGLCAALFAARAGARVEVVAAGVGTTHWMSGALDILGRAVGAEGNIVDDPLASVDKVIARGSGGAPPDERSPVPLDALRHPYAIAGRDALIQGVGVVREVLETEGVSYDGTLSRNRTVPSAVGAPRPTCLVPAAAARDDALTGRVIVVGVRGVRDFHAAWVAANLRRRGIDARAAVVDAPALTARRPQNPAIAAAALETPAALDDLARGLREAAPRADVIALPAILGVRAHASLRGALRERLGCPIYEIPTLPPSVPGIRLHAALLRALSSLGVEVSVGSPVVGARFGRGRIVSMDVAGATRIRQRSASSFIVATGGLLGGGLVADASGAIRDEALGLPVAAPTSRSDWLRDAGDRRGHPVFRSGYRVDARLRVLDERGAAIADNVAAAGSAVAGADPWRELSHEGVAIATAWRAAQTAVEAAR